MKLHPYCSIFPKMNQDEFSELCTNMTERGFNPEHPIVTLDGMILDGQNRFDACQATGIKPKFEKFIGDNPLEFVITENFRRRQLNASQRAMLAAEIATKRGEKITTDEAAKKMSVSRDSVEVAKKIKKKSKKLAGEVKAGKISLNAAEKKISGSRTERPAMQTSDFYTSAPKTEAPKETRSTGQMAYEAFCHSLGKKANWGKVDDKQKKAWQCAADAVKGKI